jgi:putative tricarboxylic transport membrane protein
MLDAYGWRMLVLVGGGIVVFVGLVNIISMYGADRGVPALLHALSRAPQLARQPADLADHAGRAVLFLRRRHADHHAHRPAFTDPVFNVLYDIIY